MKVAQPTTRICENCNRPVPAYAYDEHLAVCSTYFDRLMIVRYNGNQRSAKISQKKHDRICQFRGCDKKCWPNFFFCKDHHAVKSKLCGSGYYNLP